MDALAIARVIWVALVGGVALLAVIKVPVRLLWIPAIAATELGYILALLAAPAFVRAARTPRDALLCLVGALSVLLLLSPLARVPSVARDLPRRLDEAFGPSSASASRGAFEVRRLFAFASPDVPIETHVFASRVGQGPIALDFYGGSISGAARPLVVMIHGGSWQSGDRRQLVAMARRLAHDGYAVASIDYALAPRHPFPAALDDVRNAVDWLRERAHALGVDPDRIVLYGRSAGGHLALLAAYRWKASFVRGVVSLYGPTDLHWSWAHPTSPLLLDTPGTLRSFLGGSPDESEAIHQRYTEASPLAQVHSDSPPTLLV
ncbi:MAG: alpha/beta hydrolase, partial [Polyangiaceae bacterium]|nr:alpha/beta hydrolase [Polyangiaceae bacterium]